jgi:APA family basic amino acid/polyamine antiporter
MAYAGLAFALALSGTFEGNATLSAIVRLVTYGLTCAAVLVFRRQRPAEAPGFRLKAAPVVAPLAILFCLWLLSTRTFAQAWILVAIMALGSVFWWAAGRGRRPGGAPL